MITITRTSVIAALTLVGFFAAGVVAGLVIPTHSHDTGADFTKGPVKISENTFERKTRVVRVEEKIADAPVACYASIAEEVPAADKSKVRVFRLDGKKVVTKTCQLPEEKSAAMPNLFKK